jgi:hypothetical protein
MPPTAEFTDCASEFLGPVQAKWFVGDAGNSNDLARFATTMGNCLSLGHSRAVRRSGQQQNRCDSEESNGGKTYT